MTKPRIKKCPSGLYICGRFIGDRFIGGRWETGRGFGWSPKEAYDDWILSNGGVVLFPNGYMYVPDPRYNYEIVSPSILTRADHKFKVVGSEDLTLWQKIKRWWNNEI